MIKLPRSDRPLAVATASLALLLASSCTTQSASGGGHPSSAGAAAAVPASPATMGLVGDRHGRAEAILGAGVAALPAAAVDGYVDREEHDLRIRTAGTGIDLRRRGDEISLGVPARIAFDALGAAIRPGIRTTLDQVGRTMAQYGQGFVDIYAYAGAADDDAAALNRSQSRAQAVAGYLQSRGVAAARVATRGFGRAPAGAAAGPSPGGRVEIRLVPLTEADVAPPAGTSAAR